MNTPENAEIENAPLDANAPSGLATASCSISKIRRHYYWFRGNNKWGKEIAGRTYSSHSSISEALNEIEKRVKDCIAITRNKL